MIGDRPFCVVIPASSLDSFANRDLKREISETTAFEGDMNDEGRMPGRTVEACTAEWSKNELDEDGNKIYREELGYNLAVIHFVKCMEPAAYWVQIPSALGGGVFCEYHKPKVVCFKEANKENGK